MSGHAAQFGRMLASGDSFPSKFDPRRPANAPPTKGGRLPPQRSRHKGRRSQRGPCEAVKEPQFAKAAWWTYFLQKTEHTGRRSQRGQCEDEYQHQGDHTQHHGIYNQHQPPTQPASTMSMSTDNLQQQQQGQRQQQQQHLLFNQIESSPYPGISRSRRKWRH